jgi:putative ABC transport system permease protein
LAVIGLVANAVLLIVRGRIKENAILSALGYQQRAIAWLVIIEGCILGLAGGILGVLFAAGLLRWKSFTFGSEGQTLAIQPDSSIIFSGIIIAVLLGGLASLWPAWKAARQSIVINLRS